MHRTWVVRTILALCAMVLAGLVSCRMPELRRSERMPEVDITPTVIDYADADGFDALFESALVAQDPVIEIRTDHARPEWSARLNAWIAAWNQGGRARGRTARGQGPAPKVVIDGQTIRELRLLVHSLLDRVEDLAQSGSSWWTQERERSRRVALLRPYNLRFHMSERGTIHLVFFHGNYASYYPRHVQLLTRASELPEQEWSRGVECSFCREAKDRQGLHRLTGSNP